MGIGIDPLTRDRLLMRAEQAMRNGARYRIADVNVAKLVSMIDDADFRMAVLTADACVVDGMGVLWGMRLLGLEVPEKISGVDLFDAMMALCARCGFRPYVIGARHDVVARVVGVLRGRHPGLDFAGWRSGYFAEEEEADVLAELGASGAHCLVVALPYPRQDLFLARAQAATSTPVAFGVGGSLDVVAGDRIRAPLALRNAGLEWLFRLLQEPRRLGPRYAVTNTRFLALLASAWLARRL